MAKSKNALGGTDAKTGDMSYHAEETAHAEMIDRANRTKDSGPLIAKAVKGGPITKGGKGRGK